MGRRMNFGIIRNCPSAVELDHSVVIGSSTFGLDASVSDVP